MEFAPKCIDLTGFFRSLSSKISKVGGNQKCLPESFIPIEFPDHDQKDFEWW